MRQCKSDSVLLALVNDLKNTMSGINKDESGWVDIATYAAKTLNKSNNVVFMTPSQRAGLTWMLLKSGRSSTTNLKSVNYFFII